jgi:hypothetical protein
MAPFADLHPGDFANVSAENLLLLHAGDLVSIVGESEGFIVVDHDGILTALRPDELELPQPA